MEAEGKHVGQPITFASLSMARPVQPALSTIATAESSDPGSNHDSFSRNGAGSMPVGSIVRPAALATA